MSDSSRGSPGFEPERRTLLATVASRKWFGSGLSGKVLLQSHPEVEIAERQRIAPRWIARLELQLRMVFSKMQSQPQRYATSVLRLFGAQQLEMLVFPDQLFQRAPRFHVRLAQLLPSAP